MTIKKSVEFFAPYIANTFNDKDREIFGGSGMLRGGEVSVVSSTSVEVQPYAFVQDGLIVSDDSTTLVTVPDYTTNKKPISVILSSPDSQDGSGVTVTVASDLAGLSAGYVVVATRVDNVWNPSRRLSISGISSEAMSARGDAVGGFIEGDDVLYSKSYGTNQGLRVGPGVAVGPNGERKPLDTDTSLHNPAANRIIDIDHVDPEFNRVDKFLFRETNDGFPVQAIYAKGETFDNGSSGPSRSSTPTVNVASGASLSRPSVADNFEGKHVVVWGDGSNIKLNSLDHTAARTPSTASVVSAGAAVSWPSIHAVPNMVSGDRMFGVMSVGASGSEEIALFRTDPGGLSMSPTGSVEIITSLAHSGLRPQMVIDSHNFAHVVFQHDENGSGNVNQVYYFKYNLDDAMWGLPAAIAVSPRFARGYNSGQNDTDPHIAIDNDGNLHIAFVRATSPAIKGDIVYLVIDQTGATVEAERVISDSVGDGASGTLSVRTDHAKPRVCVSPQNDVYVAFLGDYVVPGNPYLRLFERTLKERSGFDSVEVAELFVNVGHIENIESISAFTDDLGRLTVVALLDDTTDASSSLPYYKFNPVVLSDGIDISKDIISLTNEISYLLLDEYLPTGYQDDGFFVCHDTDGSLQGVSLVSSSIDHYRWSSQGSLGRLSVSTGVVHPKDSVVATVSIPPGSSNSVEDTFAVMASTSKRDALPNFVAVGKDGSFSGYNAIQEAINSLKGVGGDVIVSDGYHRVTHSIRLWSGIRLIGSPRATIRFDSSSVNTNAILVQGSYSVDVAPVDITRHEFILFTNLVSNGHRPGDVVYLYDASGALPAYPGSNLVAKTHIVSIVDEITVILADDISTAVLSMTTPKAVVYASGCAIENIEADDKRGVTSPLVSANITEGLRLSGCNFESDTAITSVILEGNMNMSMSMCTCKALTAYAPIALDGNSDILDSRSSISSCLFLGGSAFIGTAHGFHRLSVSGCSSEEGWTVANVTDAPVWTNNGGAISGTTFDAVASWGDSATVFAESIKLNQNATVLANGHIDGDMHPKVDKSNLGTVSKRWKAALSQEVVLSDSKGISDPDTFNIASNYVRHNSATSGSTQIGNVALEDENVKSLSFFGSIFTAANLNSSEAIDSSSGSQDLTLTRSGAGTSHLSTRSVCSIYGMSSAGVNDGIYIVTGITSSTAFTIQRYGYSGSITFTAAASGTVTFLSGAIIGSDESDGNQINVHAGDNKGAIIIGTNEGNSDKVALEVRGNLDTRLSYIDEEGHFVDESCPDGIYVSAISGFGDFASNGNLGEFVDSGGVASAEHFISLDGIIPDGSLIQNIYVDWWVGHATDSAELIVSSPTPPVAVVWPAVHQVNGSQRIFQLMEPTESLPFTVDRAHSYYLHVTSGTADVLKIYGFYVVFGSKPHVSAV